MKKEWIPIMIETGQLKLKLMELLTHYMVVIFLSIPFLMNLYSLIQEHLLDSYTGVRNPEDMLVATSPFGILAIIFFFIQRNRLKFKSIKTKLSKEKINEVIEMTAKQLDWNPVLIDSRLIVAKTNPPLLTGSWGEQITIIIEKNHILINSICDPERMSSVVSFGRNRKNIRTFIENIKNASS